MSGRWFWGPAGVTASEPEPTVLERVARLESIWGGHRVVMCSFAAGRSGLLGRLFGGFGGGGGFNTGIVCIVSMYNN